MPMGKPAWTSLAALSSVVAASLCCIPVGMVLIAAGAAGASAVIEAARGWLMALSAILIVLAFYQTYSRRVEKRPLPGQILLFSSAAIVLAMFLFPERLAVLVAGGVPQQANRAVTVLNEANIESIREQFNAAQGQLRVITLLSPT